MWSKNLLIETNECLNKHGKSWDDVQFVKVDEYVFLPESFDKVKALMNFKYDAGFGSPEVIRNLMVVGADWWLEREEYDGSEWWGYKTRPSLPTEPKTWPEQLVTFEEGVYHYFLEWQEDPECAPDPEPVPAIWEDSDYRCVYSDKPLVNEG